MKKAQLIGISVAGVAGVLAFVMMGSMLKPPPKPMTEDKVVDAVKVLVAKTDIELGTVATDQSFRWQDWPKDAISPTFVTSTSKPRCCSSKGAALVRPSGKNSARRCSG